MDSINLATTNNSEVQSQLKQRNSKLIQRFNQLWDRFTDSVSQFLIPVSNHKVLLSNKLSIALLEDRNAPGNMMNGVGGLALGAMPSEAIERMFSVVGQNALYPPLCTECQ